MNEVSRSHYHRTTLAHIRLLILCNRIFDHRCLKAVSAYVLLYINDLL